MKGRFEEMRRLGLIVLSLALVLAVIVPAAAAFAASPNDHAGQFVNAGDVPGGSTLVVNVTLKVINDEDSGNVGYWALDSYNRQIQVWQLPDDGFYAVARYVGKWQTFTGARSPGDGVVQAGDGQGTLEGGYIATFDGSLKDDPDYPAFGQIGTIDYGGTEPDVLLGAYGAGQTGPATVFSWLSEYFTSTANFTQPQWGWTYHYQGQTWSNFSTGTSGDIVIP